MTSNTDIDRRAVAEALSGPGIVAAQAAFPPEWADRLREDIERGFADAKDRPGGAIGRGRNRYTSRCTLR